MKLLFFVILLTVSLMTDASTSDQYEYIYSFFRGMKIEKVVTTKRATTVYFRWKGEKGDVIYIPSYCSLVGRNGNLYAMRKLDGETPGIKCIEEEFEKSFSMSFEPLSENDSIFDIVDEYKEFNYFCFYGVHQKDVVCDIPQKENVCPHNDPKKMSCNTVICGHIEGFEGKEGKVEMYYNSSAPDYNSSKGASSVLDEQGNYAFTVTINTPHWNYLRIGNVWIPMYINPDDTIICDVKNLGKYNQEVSYHSAAGNDMHERMLNIDPKGPTLAEVSNVEAAERPKVLESITESKLPSVMRLFDYLSWKYALSDYEDHLLRLNFLEMYEMMKLMTHGTNKDYIYTPDKTVLDDVHSGICPNSKMMEEYYKNYAE